MSPKHEEHQFNAADADVILVSSEGTEFRVHKCILSAASPFFRDMFCLPQPPSEDDCPLPLIPVSEPAGTLRALLQFIYPIPDPTITSLDELSPLLNASIKYDLPSLLLTLRALLVSPQFLHSAPTRVFAIASRYDLEPEAQLASQYTLNINILDSSDTLHEDLKYITAYSYHRLLDLHRRRARAALDVIKRVAPQNTPLKCMQCNGSSYGSFILPKWWYEWEKRAKEELMAKPTTDVIFGMEFLAQTVRETGCARCAGSVLDNWKFLEELKAQIDELPKTI